jgi:hypothetical protein
MDSEEKRESGEARKPTEESRLLLLCSRKIPNSSKAEGAVAEEDCGGENEEERDDEEDDRKMAEIWEERSEIGDAMVGGCLLRRSTNPFNSAGAVGEDKLQSNPFVPQ